MGSEAITAAAMARELGWACRTFRDWVAAGKVPYVIGEGRKLFEPAKVVAAIAAQLPKPGHKGCSKCKRELLLECFDVIGQGKKGPRYQSACKGCCTLYKRARRRAAAVEEGRADFRSREETRAVAEARDAARLAKVKGRRDATKAKAEARKAQLKAEGRGGMAYTSAESQRRVDRQRYRYNSDPNYKAKQKAKKIRRKRAMDGTMVVPINHIEIAERDGWTCAICHGQATLKDWSLDHIVPLSLGGHHVHSNVTLAHVSCNSRRGVKPYETHPLFLGVKGAETA